jgi:hypothetical protein
MSGLGAGHVREKPLESGLEAGYARLTWKKAERPDMSDLTGVFGGKIDFYCFALNQLI